MKRWMTLLLSAVMLLSLTACGRKKDNAASDDRDDGSVTDHSGHDHSGGSNSAADNDADMGSNYETPHIDGAQTPAEQSGESAAKKSGDAVKRAADDAVRDAKETLEGESWDGMLRNARVRDTDGMLKDGENALHGRYGAVN